MEEVNALHEKFENPRTRRTYRSGQKGFDVSASCRVGTFPKQPTIQQTAVTYNFVVAIQQEWAKKYIKDHDGVIKAEDVTKYMLLKFRKALNIHGKVSCKIIISEALPSTLRQHHSPWLSGLRLLCCQPDGFMLWVMLSTCPYDIKSPVITL